METKLELASDPLFDDLKDRAMAIARSAPPRTRRTGPHGSEVVEIDTYGEAPPTTRDAMFAIMRDRLEDIDDLLCRCFAKRGVGEYRERAFDAARIGARAPQPGQ